MTHIRVNKDIKELLDTLQERLKCRSMSELILRLVTGGDYVSSIGLKFKNKWLPTALALSLGDFPEGKVVKDIPNLDIIYIALKLESLKKMPWGWFAATIQKAIWGIEMEAKKYNYDTQPIYAVKDSKLGVLTFYSLYPKDTKRHVVNKNPKRSYRKDDPRF